MRHCSKWLMAALLAATIGGGWPSAVLAQGPGPGQRGGDGAWARGEGRHGGRGRAALRLLRNEEVRDKLGLSAQQRQGLDDLYFDSAHRMVQLRADLKELRLEMARLGRAEKPDRAALEAKLEQVSAVRTEMGRLRLDAMLKVRDLLTLEQRDLLKSIAREHRTRPR